MSSAASSPSAAAAGPAAQGASAAAARHRAKVEQIARAVRTRAGRGESVHVHKGGVHHVVPLPGDRRFQSAPIDVSCLDEVLEIDRERRVCVAEPGVTFARVVEATLPLGLAPLVVPELEGITVGGAVAGCSVESMSFRHGGFHDTCLEYELVSGTGEIVVCSPEHERPIFDMIHGSYGTLGILTRLTFRLVPARPYVQMEYRRLDTIEAYEAELRARVAAGDFDFIDGIIHGPGQFVLCLGRFADTAATPPADYRRRDIFYRSTLARTSDTLRTADYFFRYDAECHWLSRTVPPLEWRAVRLLAGRWLLGSTNLIRWSNRLGRLLGAVKKRPDVVCDVFIPARRFAEFYRWYEETFRFFPLWIVPYRIATPYPWLAEEHVRRMNDELFIDCAIYGKPNGEPDVDYSKLLEDKTFELDGIKTLISRNHYTPERFWQIYSRPNVEAAKARLDPQGVFPGLFEKLHRVG